VLDFLEREPRLRVVGSITEPDALFRLASTANPNVTVVCPMIGRDLRHPAANGRAPHLLLVGEEMTVPVLREAIEAGVRGVFAWPEERQELVRTIVAAPREDETSPAGRGRVIAVVGARGGAGATFLATHLAAAFSDQGRMCVLVDVDGSFADVTAALGIAGQTETRTTTDLLPVAQELTSDHVEDALHHHERGFSVLLAPIDPSPSSPLLAALYDAAVRLLAQTHDVVILHLPRSLEDTARAAINLSDEVVLVMAPALSSLHSARRVADAFGLREPSGRCRIVINQLVRGGVGPGEVEQAVGIQPSAGIRFDPRVGRAQDRGELLRGRSRGAGRDIEALARLLVPAHQVLHSRG
jgi:pilus assembly protein CpaE